MTRKPKKLKKNMKGRPRGGASVPCPTCASDSHVELTRRDGDTVMRTRKCLGRGKHLFRTAESAA